MVSIHASRLMMERFETEFDTSTCAAGRCLTCFPDSQGYMVGSVEGRVAVQHLEDAQQSKNFTFKCHRDGNDVYAVNAITFHPQYGTFVTSGSDGSYNFWDKVQHSTTHRLNFIFTMLLLC